MLAGMEAGLQAERGTCRRGWVASESDSRSQTYRAPSGLVSGEASPLTEVQQCQGTVCFPRKDTGVGRVTGDRGHKEWFVPDHIP